ncbi:MAG: bifunctional serine/threonine-protein kinase/formylglycine-generating enzyme family protein [Proteobacteria bacterium]|nr:bifunctional serine/threonine-protein kinase/formylglycine-generating enzyme family protein [Pseudomonadota bacterium]
MAEETGFGYSTAVWKQWASGATRPVSARLGAGASDRMSGPLAAPLDENSASYLPPKLSDGGNGDSAQSTGQRERGVVLLVEGYDAVGRDRGPLAAARPYFSSVGQLLLACDTPRFSVDRLSPDADEPRKPTPANLRTYIDRFARAAVGEARVGVCVLSLSVFRHQGRLTAIAGTGWQTYPDSASVPLHWIGHTLAGSGFERLFVAVHATPAAVPGMQSAAVSAGEVLHQLDLDHQQCALAAYVAESSSPLLDVAFRALCGEGEALDRTTGTVTLGSLRQFFDQQLSGVVVTSTQSATHLISPPGLQAMWQSHERPSRAFGSGSFLYSRLSRRTDESAQSGRADKVDAGQNGRAGDLSGRILRGGFDIVGPLDAGSFGTVYKARQTRIGREVAVKVLKDFDPGGEDGALFLREIQSIGRLDHRNIVRIYHADITEDGRLFFAMERLRGPSLQTLLEQKTPWTRSQAVSIIRQVLAGLAAAHRSGIIHSDIKPGNIVIVPPSDDGDLDRGEQHPRVVLLDFGLARLGYAGEAARSFAGTPSFMAPETFYHGRADERSDLFSVALVFIEMLTGWARSSEDDMFPPPAAVDVGDDHLRGVLERATAKEPDQRFQTARDFIDALDGELLSVPEAIRERAPFRKLLPYGEEDMQRFFGRDEAVAELIDYTLCRRAVIVSAPSGTGKTSLLRAGLVPRLRGLRKHPVYVHWRGDGSHSLLDALLTHARRSRPNGGDSRGLAGGGMFTTGSNRPAGVRLPREGGLSGDRASIDSESGHSASRAAAGDRSGGAGDGDGSADRGYSEVLALLGRCIDDAGDDLVLILDQIESLFLDTGRGNGRELLRQVVGASALPGGRVTIVLSIRDEFLARLLTDISTWFDEIVPMYRLGPLKRAEARTALLATLTEHRVTMQHVLENQLLDDLEAAAADLGPQMGWSHEEAIYPPHLQLTGSVLYSALKTGETELTLAHYDKLGRFKSIVGEHLDRVLATELDEQAEEVARDLFVELCTSAKTRRARSEFEILRILGRGHDAEVIRHVLEVLRTNGLLLPVKLDGDKPGWELMHDSLVERVLDWADRKDLARRKAKELVRYHLRRSLDNVPSLLSRRELREVLSHKDIVDELDSEFAHAMVPAGESGAMLWTARSLVHRSQWVIRVRVGSIAVIGLAVVIVAGWALARWNHEKSLQYRDLGRAHLVLSPFDWDADELAASPVRASDLPDLAVELYEPDPDNLDDPGTRVASERFLLVGKHGYTEDGALRQPIEARGGLAYLKISGRGRPGQICEPSWIRIKNLPGYAQRDTEPDEIRLTIPTCQATLAGTVAVWAGQYYKWRTGNPPSEETAKDDLDINLDIKEYLDTYRMDKTETSNAAYRVYVSNTNYTGTAFPIYPEHWDSSGGRYPVSFVSWQQAREYCRFMGKTLPSSEQWTKAARGGIYLDANQSQRNPDPMRRVPWGEKNRSAAGANLQGQQDGHELAAPTDDYPEGSSPYGVLNLVGNVAEWTRTRAGRKGELVVKRGGDWGRSGPDRVGDLMLIRNTANPRVMNYVTGFRCSAGHGSRAVTRPVPRD